MNMYQVTTNVGVNMLHANTIQDAIEKALAQFPGAEVVEAHRTANDLYRFEVFVATDSLEHAKTAMLERLSADEDYGFDYSIYTWNHMED